jgi:MFS family permease
MSGFFVCGFSLATISTHFIAFATDLGTSAAVLVTALAILGGFSVVGTLLAGVVSDRLGCKNPLTFIYLIQAAAFAILLASDAPWALYLFAVLFEMQRPSILHIAVEVDVETHDVRAVRVGGGVIIAARGDLLLS